MGKSFIRKKAAKMLWNYRNYKKKQAFIKYGEETLRRTFKAFKDIDKTMWLDYGTLLGAVRDKDFIEYDADLDVSTFIGDADKVEKSMINNGLRKIREFEVDNKIVEQTYQYNGSSIDIFYNTLEGDKVWAYAFYSNPTCNVTFDKTPTMLTFRGWKTTKATFTYKGFTKLNFKGCEFDVPADTDLYLTEAYGNYKVRIKDYDSTTQSPNIEQCESISPIGREYYY